MAALVSGGSGSDAGLAQLTYSPHGSAGQIHGSAQCLTGGRVDLVFVREYVPTGGSFDTSALKAVFSQCSFTRDGASVQMNGELTLSGAYQGVSQPVEVRLSGSLSTSAGDCPVDASLTLTGSFSGTACGQFEQVRPQARSAAALAAVGNYALTVLGGSSLPRVVVNEPCIGYMNSGALALRADGTYEISMLGSFVCLNGPGPNVSYAEPGYWALVGDTIVVSTIGTHLFAPSGIALGGSSVTMQLDVPSSAPDIPPARMAATFTR
jgi:hypothetical protein